jgi:dethiobiotin synthetase
MKGYCIAGIGTEVGKTVVSAIVTKALNATYYKPIQAGDLDYSDTDKVVEWCGGSIKSIPNAYALKTPMAPHEAANLEQVQIRLDNIPVPPDAPLVLEGAGGILVPLNENGETILDVYQKSQLPVIVVSRHYLGSINHTLLTLEVLKSRGCPIHGIIYVGSSPHSVAIIERFTGIRTLGEIPSVEEVTPEFVAAQADLIKPFL